MPTALLYRYEWAAANGARAGQGKVRRQRSGRIFVGDQTWRFAMMPGHVATIGRLVSFLQEHRRCGELESGIDDRWVWMVCECGARIMQRIPRAIIQNRQSNERPSSSP